MAQADIDLVDVMSGDLRIKALESQLSFTKERIPIGIVKGHLINFARDPYWMLKLFGGV